MGSIGEKPELERFINWQHDHVVSFEGQGGGKVNSRVEGMI